MALLKKECAFLPIIERMKTIWNKSHNLNHPLSKNFILLRAKNYLRI